MHKYLTIIFSILTFQCYSQIEINNSIMAVPGDSIQISNLGLVTDSSALISLDRTRKNNHLFFESNIISDTAYISIDTTITNIKSGLVIYLKTLNPNSGKLILRINNSNFEVLKNNGSILNAGDMIIDKVSLLIYNDGVFHYLNPERGNCPNGFVQPNKKYCIQINEQLGNFWQSVDNCLSNNYRLCTWSEWYYACSKRVDLGLNGMINNWEWVNQAQNEEHQAKGVGSGKCEIAYHWGFTGILGYRCCFNY
jgi:hypothetical protein